MEEEIKRILNDCNNCNNCPISLEYKELKKCNKINEEINENLFNGNILLSNDNKWLKKDIRILIKFILENFPNQNEFDDDIKRIINSKN